ncbi:MAG: hypothetical protein AB7G12_07455 [Thermoanaerobaculia bacterium]
MNDLTGLCGRGSAARLTALLAFLPMTLVADICTVPGTHATVRAAVEDGSCSEIDLAVQSYPESVWIGRSLALVGPSGGGAVLAGLLEVRGAGVVVAASHLRVENSCQPAATVATGGARLDGSTLEVVVAEGGACPLLILFEDGFETGNLTAWDQHLP